jgi:hypothetical protein
MPAYNAAPVAALYPGPPIACVNNAAVDAGVTTSLQFSVAPSMVGAGVTLMIANTTNQDAQGQFSSTDVSANYKNLSGCIIPSGTVLPYNLSGGWMRFTFAVAPTSGSLVVSR